MWTGGKKEEKEKGERRKKEEKRERGKGMNIAKVNAGSHREGIEIRPPGGVPCCEYFNFFT